MTVARSTEGCGPTTTAKPRTTASAPSEARRRETRASASTVHVVEATSATLKPDTAST